MREGGSEGGREGGREGGEEMWTSRVGIKINVNKNQQELIFPSGEIFPYELERITIQVSDDTANTRKLYTEGGGQGTAAEHSWAGGGGGGV